MSESTTWYQVDISRYFTGRITKLEVVKETDQTLFVTRPDDQKPRAIRKESSGHVCVNGYTEARRIALDTLRQQREYHRSQIATLEARMNAVIAYTA